MTSPRNTDTPASTDSIDTVAADLIRSIVDRVERLESEIRDRNEDKSAVYQEAKSAGLDPRIIKKVVAIRRQDRDKRIEEETVLGLYLAAVGEAQ